jgi:hypothetical protein
MDMKGIAGVILAATPLALIVLYYALSGGQQVRVDQQRMQTDFKVIDAKFDLEFDLANREIDKKPMAPEELAKRKTEIAKLENDWKKWEERFDGDFAKMDAELEELKGAINE